MKTIAICSAIFSAPLILALAGANKEFPTAGSLEKIDPAFDSLAPAGTTIEKVGTCCKWLEGPVWVHFESIWGYLLFADIPGNRILKWKSDGNMTTFMEKSGYQGDSFTGPEPGSNGMTVDRHGRLTVAGHARRNVYRLEHLSANATITVLADHYQNKRLNSPNDLVYARDGSLYFTDPPYGLPKQDDTDPQKELDFNGVFRIRDATTHRAGSSPDPGKLDLLIKDLTRPNGICFSPDEKILYIAVSDPQHKVWMRYDVKPDGTVANGSVFYDATSAPGDGGPDGIKVDKEGNLYGAGPGGVWVFSPAGKHLGTFNIPERVANCNWGDDGHTLYITASSSLYRVRLSVAGVLP
jgi:gluconolactonase